MNKRQIGLELLRIDLIKENKMTKETLRYLIEHRINVYSPDVKEIFKKFQR